MDTSRRTFLKTVFTATLAIVGASTVGCASATNAASSPAGSSSTADSASQEEPVASSASSQAASAESSSASASPEALASILYMGQGSLRIVTPEDKVIYIDPYAGDGYDLPADLILITHGHFDHNAVDLIEQRNDGCQTITQSEALADGEYHIFDLDYATIVPVQAGFNANHDVNSCVGYVIELSNGIKVYATGDTSTTDDMRDGTLAAMNIDYAFWCSDGVYNMGNEEAAEAARMVGAKHNIPYHNATTDSGEVFDPEAAASFDAPNAMVVLPGEEITL